MEQSLSKTSFIPKQVSGAPRRQRRTFNVLTFIATVVFLATLALAIGVFFYAERSRTQLEARKAELAEIKGSFAPQRIESIQELERRLNAAQTLLDQHISLSRFFDALEARTQSNAQIASFEYERLPSGAAQVTLGGKASTFNTVALQEQQYSTETAFEQNSVLFSGLNLIDGEDGGKGVTFTVSANLDTQAVAYIPVSDSFVETTQTSEALEGSQEANASTTGDQPQ